MLNSNTPLFYYVLGLVIYLFYGYVNYRILAKFDSAISLWQNFIPLWNWYLIIKQVIAKPLLYLILILISIIALISLTRIGHHEWFQGMLNVLLSVLIGNLWGELAKALGKSYPIYSVLGYSNLFFLVILKIAFDKSYPIDNKE